MAERTGVSVSALRFYEAEGMVSSTRSTGGQRRFARDVLRRVAFIRVAQRVGLTLDEIRGALADACPTQRTPTAADWARLSRAWKAQLDERIQLLELVRDDLSSCIGCGCLSLHACRCTTPTTAPACSGRVRAICSAITRSTSCPSSPVAQARATVDGAAVATVAARVPKNDVS